MVIDLSKLTPEQIQMRENGYRAGYEHGARHALRAVALFNDHYWLETDDIERHTWLDVILFEIRHPWLETKVMEWRYERSDARRIQAPPAPESPEELRPCTD